MIEPSHLDLCCLQKPIIMACGIKRVKPVDNKTEYMFFVLSDIYFTFTDIDYGYDM